MWLGSKLFAAGRGIGLRRFQRLSIKSCEKILSIDTRFFVYLENFNCRGGRSGKILKIWSEGFESKERAEAFLRLYEKALSEGMSEVEFEAWAWGVSEAEIKERKNELEKGFKEGLKGDESLKNGVSEGLTKSDEREIKGFGAYKEFEKELSCQGGNQKATTFTTFTTLRKNGALKGIENSKSAFGGKDTQKSFEREFNQALSEGKKEAGLLRNGTNEALKGDEAFFKESELICKALKSGAFLKNEGLKSFTREDKEARALNSLNTRLDECKEKARALKSGANKARARNVALEKLSVIKEWHRAKKELKVRDFIALINTKKDYSFVLSENKLFAWQRAFEKAGFDGLVDSRGGKRVGNIESLGLNELVDKLIMASRGRVNISSMHRLLHAHLAMRGLCDMQKFLAKESEMISYAVLERYVKNYLKINPVQKTIIQKGEDGAVSRFLPALGVSNYKVSTINEVVEIDATSIDAIIDTSAVAAQLGIEVSDVQAWQKRFVLISLVDTYSGICSFHISDTENSLGVARAIAKYIMQYGKPKLIKSDNGSAFISKYIKEVLLRLDIKSQRTPAYSGWCKPYVERNFARLQNNLMEWLKGYIGHSVSQRQAIEFFFSRSQRRLKRGQKSNYKDLHSLAQLSQIIDEYAQSFMNNAFLQRLEKTPNQAFNEKIDEVVAMNEYELSSKLSPLEKRAVGKKGIAYGGVFFYSTKIYEFANVFVARNINNSNELFVYDEKKNFIDIAKMLDNQKGVSAEEAKAAQKHFKKQLKETKAKMQEARTWVQTQTPEVYAELAKTLPKAKKPAYKPINDKLLESAKLKNEAKVSGGDILKLAKTSKETKRNLSWEEAVLKDKKGGF